MVETRSSKRKRSSKSFDIDKTDNKQIKKDENSEEEKETHYISEDQDFDKMVDEILKTGNIGDRIHYVTNNQLGYRIFEIIKSKSKDKDIKNIGDIYGFYDDPSYPEIAF